MTSNPPIPMVDLQAQLAPIRVEIDAALRRVLDSCRFVLGQECSAFEREWALFCGVDHCCGVANGTDALTLSLRAHGIGPGDEVVTVANTFIATGEAILLCGARPVFVDVDPETATMAPGRLEAAITPRTRLIIPVHLYGHPADMDPILGVAARHGIPVLEDAAQAHGASYRGRRAGGLGHAACFSFYPGKNLGAFGEAGAVVSNDAGFIDRVRRLANHGTGAKRYEHLVPGTNARLDSLQAAILRVKLTQLEAWNAKRRDWVGLYSSLLEGVPDLELPREMPWARSAWHLFTIRSDRRDAIAAHLQSQSIASAVHYPRPIHLQPAMAEAGGREGDLPVSEALCRRVLSLPLYPELTEQAVRRIADEVRSALST